MKYFRVVMEYFRVRIFILLQLIIHVADGVLQSYSYVQLRTALSVLYLMLHFL